MDRRLLVLIVAVVALIGVVNATAFAYRWITGTINIAGPDQATGAACTGFYSSADQSGIDLPSVGTNYNAQTYGSNKINVETGDIVCNWTKDGKEYKLYESIKVTIPVTVGSWYIQDFYGFGYHTGTESVYVYFRVDDDAADSSVLTTAYLIIRNPDGSEIARLDLTQLGDQTSAIEFQPGQAVRLDLYFDARSESDIQSASVTFKVGVYVTQESGEAPTIGTSP